MGPVGALASKGHDMLRDPTASPDVCYTRAAMTGPRTEDRAMLRASDLGKGPESYRGCYVGTSA
ncbi:hypothetical protein VCV18_011701 [Metarhizium anisopliae]